MANHFPFAAESVHAPVTDAEFRTYVLLCALAWQTHPEADPPYVELTYAELAEKHPKPVAVPTLRVRVMTLVKLGYLRREQVNRATWRTYVTGLAPLPPSGGGGTTAFSPKLPDKAGQPRPIIVQRNRGGEKQPSASSPQPDRPVITLDADKGDRPMITLDADEGDRPMITLDTGEGDRPVITLDAGEGDRPVIILEPDRPTITLNDASAPTLSWGDMIRQNVDYSAFLDGDTSRIPEPKAPKGRLFQRDTGDPVLARGRARERHFFQVTSPKPDRPVITLNAAESDHPTITLEPDHPVITLVEPDRPVITLDAAEGDRPTITHEPDQPVITLDSAEGDRPMITLVEPDRPVITLEGNLAEGDHRAITLAPSRAHARVRAHADQDQDQITDLTDPDLIKLDLKNKKSDQSDQTPKDLERARAAKPEADSEFSAWARTGNVVPDADADFGLSARTGMGDEALAGADLPDSDPDFCFSSRTGVGDEILAGADLPDSDPDFCFSSRTGVGEGTSLPDSHAQAPSRQPSADRSGLTVPQAATSGKSNPGRQPSKNPPLTAPQASVTGPTAPAPQPATKPSLTAPQAPSTGRTRPTRQAAKKPSLTAPQAPTLEAILVSLDESHRALAHDLLALKPEPMDLKGVAEVMANPILTAAWYAWAADPANGVRKPAAYLRSMVRKGYFPPPRPGDEPDELVSTVDADGVDRSNPNYDVWPGGFTVGKGEIFDPTTYIHPSRRNDLVWP